MAPIVAVSSRVASGDVGLSLLEAAMLLHAPNARLYSVESVFWNGPGNHPRRCGTETAPEVLRDVLAQVFEDAGEDADCFVGYLRTPAQVEAVANVLTDRKPRHLLLDPISGDGGRLYVPKETAEAIRSLLLPKATMLVPNITELAFLLYGGIPETLHAKTLLADALSYLPDKSIIATSVPFDATGNLSEGDGEQLGVSLLHHGGITHHYAPRLSIHPLGTGDLFSGLLLAEHFANNMSLEEAISSVFHSHLLPTLRRWRSGESLKNTLARKEH